MKSKTILVFFMILTGIALVGAAPAVTKTSVLPEAKAAHEFCRSATPNAEGEPLPDSTQTRCLDKKEGTETFSCEGSYSEIGEECGQTFEADKKDLQKEIKNEREFCRESEDATCEKRKN